MIWRKQQTFFQEIKDLETTILKGNKNIYFTAFMYLNINENMLLKMVSIRHYSKATNSFILIWTANFCKVQFVFDVCDCYSFVFCFYFGIENIYLIFRLLRFWGQNVESAGNPFIFLRLTTTISLILDLCPFWWL